MALLACTAPEIMLARIGAATSRIRLGSGGIMLPHYTALKVAETFRTLHALYPGRIDLGIGRAPGGGPIEATALRRYRDAPRNALQVDDFPEQLSELIAFLHHGFPDNHPFSRVSVEPAGPGAPALWLLGSSLWSARAAAEFGLPYAFAHFFSGEGTRQAIEHYQKSFPGEPGAGAGPPEGAGSNGGGGRDLRGHGRGGAAAGAVGAAAAVADPAERPAAGGDAGRSGGGAAAVRAGGAGRAGVSAGVCGNAGCRCGTGWWRWRGRWVWGSWW